MGGLPESWQGIVAMKLPERLYRRFVEIDPQKAEAFAREYRYGENLNPGNPILKLRNTSINLPTKKLEDAIVKTWDAYLTYEQQATHSRLQREPIMKTTRFSKLAEAAGKTPAETGPVRGRPKGTAPDSSPVTFHISAETYRRARITLLENKETRPLSKIVEALLQGWSEGRLEV